ncbi:MAG TPA: type 4a pilus biogenesis protein PilO [Nitrospiria bacterium]|nr:type 4a pilus biogenesis protein PilO [Nitrospiria bacterium]
MNAFFRADFVRQLLARLRRDRITSRERIYIIIGGVTLVGLLLYGLYSAATSYLDRTKEIDRLIRQKEEALTTLDQFRREYVQIKGQVGALDERIGKDQGNFSLLSFLESLAGTTDVRSKIAYMRPQAAVPVDQYRETSVEMKIENVTLDQAVRFLSAIEQAPHVLKIKNLHFKTRYADPQFLDVTFLVSTYEKSG